MTRWCKVVGVVRCDRLKAVEQGLLRIGVDGMSVVPVRGFGEYKDLFRKDLLCEHARVEVYCPREIAEEVALAVLKAAHTGLPGDGLVAIEPVDALWRVREQRRLG